jgi:5-methylcytosine-specific restriction endonuclease McrA
MAGLHGTMRWRRVAKHQLREHPLCAFCLKRGTVTAASVADHIEPHKGDQDLFWNGALQSLCKLCHDSAKAQQEKRGYCTDIGVDGWPIDPLHPANSHKF